MAAKRLSPQLVIVVAVLVAGAAWLSGGALALTSPQPYAARIGVLPSPAWLALWMLIAFAGATAMRAAPRRVALLALSGVLWIPWLPLPIPAVAYLWTGQLRAWLWMLIAAAIILPAIPRLAPAMLVRLTTDPRRAPWLAAALAATLYLVAASRVFPQLPAGDEPHYLVITQSLLLDHDLKIENNHRSGDYRAYYPVDLKPDYRRRGADDEIYSIHAPGLAVVIAPVFAWLGYPGVLGFLGVLSGFASALAWIAAWRITADARATWFGWAVVALTAPFLFQSFVAYPDALGAGLVMAGVLALVDGATVRSKRLMLTGIALALLPWLHTRYVVLAVSLGVVLFVRQIGERRRVSRVLSLLAAPLVSAVCWFGFFYAIYGTPDPRAPYGGATQNALTSLPQGAIGLLFDQQFGLLPAAPVYLCALLGLLILARRLPRLAFELLAVFVPYGLVVATYEMWWGGESSPARFLVPILLPLSIPTGLWFHTRRGQATRLLALGALAVSLLVSLTLAGVDRGALLYNSRDGASRLLLWLSPLVNLTTGLPSVFRGGSASALARAAVWLLAIALTAAAGILAERRGTTTARVALVTGFSALLTSSAALSLVWRVHPASPVTAFNGTLAFLQRYDPDTQSLAFRSAPFRRIDAREVLAALTLADIAPAALGATEPVALLFRVPAGTYAVEASSGADASGLLGATLDRSFGSQWQWSVGGPSGRAWRQEIRLPIGVPALQVNADADARRSLDRIRLRPVSILGSSHPRADGEPQHVVRYGPAVVFLMRGSAYVEPGGTWVEGGTSADFVIAPDNVAGGSRLHLFVRNPPVDNVVTLEGDNWRQELMLKPGEERLVSLPAPSVVTGGLTLRVATVRGARPKEFAPGSTDTRLLGCWIEVRP